MRRRLSSLHESSTGGSAWTAASGSTTTTRSPRMSGAGLSGAGCRRRHGGGGAWVRPRRAGPSLLLWVHYYDPHAPYEPRGLRRTLRPPSDTPARSPPSTARWAGCWRTCRSAGEARHRRGGGSRRDARRARRERARHLSLSGRPGRPLSSCPAAACPRDARSNHAVGTRALASTLLTLLGFDADARPSAAACQSTLPRRASPRPSTASRRCPPGPTAGAPFARRPTTGTGSSWRPARALRSRQRPPGEPQSLRRPADAAGRLRRDRGGGAGRPARDVRPGRSRARRIAAAPGLSLGLELPGRRHGSRRTALPCSPSSSRPGTGRGRAETGEAVAKLRDLVQRSPGNVPFLARLGEAEVAVGETAAGLATFRRAIALNPELDFLHSHIARLYAGSGRLRGGARGIRGGPRAEPPFRPRLARPGRDRLASGSGRRRVASPAPGRGGRHQQRGDLRAPRPDRASAGDLAEARRHAEESLRLAPDVAAAWWVAARLPRRRAGRPRPWSGSKGPSRSGSTTHGLW